ncbi:hypothetical protein VTK56DRAFT_30 [Thermocarpiscus australiensis]
MVDRHAPSSRALASGISKTRSSAISSSSHSVRRNLFQSQLTRRPTASASTSSTGILHLDTDVVQKDPQYYQQHSFQSQREASSSPGDIVVRDQNGEIELGDPPTPPIDDADTRAALEARHENEERQRLADAVKQHQIDQNGMPGHTEGKDPNRRLTRRVSVPITKTADFATTTELLEAVRASLRAKVAALAEDNWMFEREELPHHQ